MKQLSPIIWMLTLLSPLVLAGEGDFELDFYFKQKSTINDFPFREIDQGELSDAAISGALQTATARSAGKKGKPAFVEQQDISDKQKQSELQPIDIDPGAGEVLRFGQNRPIGPEIQADPFFDPAGRHYDGFSFKAFERP